MVVPITRCKQMPKSIPSLFDGPLNGSVTIKWPFGGTNQGQNEGLRNKLYMILYLGTASLAYIMNIYFEHSLLILKI